MRSYGIGMMVLLLVLGTAVAGDLPPDWVKIQNLPAAGASGEVLPPADYRARLTGLAPYATDDPIGEVDTVGTTWYDYQHNGTIGRMVAVDDSGQIHVDWMNGLQSGAADRHVYYNMRNTQGDWLFTNIGIPIESAQRAGYCVIDVGEENRPFPSFHIIWSPNPRAHTTVAADLFPGIAAFSDWEAPWVTVGGVDIQVIWPKIAIDEQYRIHVFDSQEMVEAGDPMALYYVLGTWDSTGMQVNYGQRMEVDTCMTIAHAVAASRVSDRVAIAWTKPRGPRGDWNQYNNDIIALISEDGVTWNLSDTINVTDFIPPDLSLLPDTTAADKDTLRAYTDINLFFDDNDYLHVAFTTPWYDELRGLISRNNSWLWHWSEETEWYSLVADGSFDYQAPAGVWVLSCGAWQRYVQRPCLGHDPSTGYLYCLYQEYDTTSISSADYPQGELMVSVSTNNGVHWSVGTDITNTHAPGAEPWHCLSERDPSMTEVVDEYLRVLYVLDLDAGSVIQTPQEGTWTENPVCYQEVPVSEISTTPLMPRYPMHVDSTGIQPAPGAVHMVESDKVPTSFHLAQNYPNPFNPSTTIRFDVTRGDHVTLTVYNVVGQEVATLVDGNLMVGSYQVRFEGSELSSGVYFYKLNSATQTATRKMVLLK
jgi:hypothetical protein